MTYSYYKHDNHGNYLPTFDDKILYTLENDPDFISHDHFSLAKHKEIILNEYCTYIVKYENTFAATINLSSKYISHNKGFVRFELFNNDLETINSALNQISNIVIEYECGGTVVYRINLQLNLILMKEYGLEITIIDVEQLKNHYDIDSLIYNNDGTLNSKYIFENEFGYYLDIPLFEEFYYYDKNILLHNISY
jgi:hypothetical protein